jgi:hypothetical protein
MAKTIAGLVKRSFQLRQTPEGERWAPLKLSTIRRTGRTAPLEPYESRVVVTVTGDDTLLVEIRGRPESVYHLKKTKWVSARRWVPQGGRLPAEWKAAGTRVLTARLRELLGNRR